MEDLLRQADELIAGKKQEVYADMAESLGRAWKLLNQYLERRRELLQQNFLFHGHFQVIHLVLHTEPCIKHSFSRTSRKKQMN